MSKLIVGLVATLFSVSVFAVSPGPAGKLPSPEPTASTPDAGQKADRKDRKDQKDQQDKNRRDGTVPISK